MAHEEVCCIHDLVVHDYGPGQRFGSLHVEMDQAEDPLSCHELIDDLERLCLEKHNIHLVIHYDPVNTADPLAQSLRRTVEDILRDMDERFSIHDFRVVWGVTHSNLVFDIAVPFSVSDTDSEVRTRIEKAISAIDPAFRTVITVDRG